MPGLLEDWLPWGMKDFGELCTQEDGIVIGTLEESVAAAQRRSTCPWSNGESPASAGLLVVPVRGMPSADWTYAVSATILSQSVCVCLFGRFLRFGGVSEVASRPTSR